MLISSYFPEVTGTGTHYGAHAHTHTHTMTKNIAQKDVLVTFRCFFQFITSMVLFYRIDLVIIHKNTALLIADTLEHYSC